ncbi:MAG TPA: exopolysaccharide biosynthesis polyprenyl glycosylphosphotransferase [Sedimentisphaerales bacterium]|nr:exopolysaccharide biosynthesis polyprenyl glycosylphosphotransferase [Sedimentisphaerales bacterium]
MIVKILLLLVDAVLINIAFLLSFLIRFGTDIPDYNFNSYKGNFLFLTFMYMLAFSFARFFKNRFQSHWDLFKRITHSMALGTLFGIALVYVFRTQWSTFPTSIFLISFPAGLIIIFLSNDLILNLTGRIKKIIIIIGQESGTEAIENNKHVEKIHIDKIEDLVWYKDADEVVICERVREDKQMNLLIYLLLRLKVNVLFSPSIYAELLSGNVMDENSIQFLATFLGRKSDSEEFLIRALDVLGSAFILILLSPLMLTVLLLIRLTSSGPVLYKQSRISKDGKTFTLYKFKTMINDAEKQTGPVLADENDPRVTRIGRFLRRTRIDELPQLLNVIRGDMSLVGPRPERLHFVKRHKALREIRLAVKPGLTGLAQIRNAYNLHPNHKVKYDYLYIQRRSFLLNLYILAKTIPVVLLKKGW